MRNPLYISNITFNAKPFVNYKYITFNAKSFAYIKHNI